MSADSDFDGVIDGAAAIAVGVYIAVVFARGNISQLLAEVRKETGYLEFLVASFLVYKLLSLKFARPIIPLLVLGAVIVAAQRFVAGTGVAPFQKYAAGTISLFELAAQIFGG